MAQGIKNSSASSLITFSPLPSRDLRNKSTSCSFIKIRSLISDKIFVVQWQFLSSRSQIEHGEEDSSASRLVQKGSKTRWCAACKALSQALLGNERVVLEKGLAVFGAAIHRDLKRKQNTEVIWKYKAAAYIVTSLLINIHWLESLTEEARTIKKERT